MVFPAFQRTYATSSSNAIGTSLRYALEFPDPDSPDTGRGGMGFCLVQWTAHAATEFAFACSCEAYGDEGGMCYAVVGGYV